MREINLVVVHCSASPGSQDIGFKEIDAEHARLGWCSPSGIHCGYHYIIRRDGTVEPGRPPEEVGAHAAPFNTNSLGICLVGGVDEKLRPQKNFLREQFDALGKLLDKIREDHPRAAITGHRDLSPDLDKDGQIEPWEWIKQCPCFDVALWCTHNGIDPFNKPEPPTASVAAIQ